MLYKDLTETLPVCLPAAAALWAPLLQQCGPSSHLRWLLRCPGQLAAIPGLPGWPAPPASTNLIHRNCWPEIASKAILCLHFYTSNIARLRCFQLECQFEKCSDVWFTLLAVRKSCGCAALSSSWNCRDQPVWPHWCFNGHRKEPTRREHRSRYWLESDFLLWMCGGSGSGGGSRPSSRGLFSQVLKCPWAKTAPLLVC